MPDDISVAGYLFTRLHQLGVRSVHGVPGDFFLNALDHLEPAGLKWIGNCNELNAGYAADGYARVKGLSAVFTTFGVGEMSAWNALAGAFSEYSPVVHIAGTPNRRIQRSKAIVHHSLGDGNMRVFMETFRPITVALEDLQDVEQAPEQIDTALRQALVHKRPVYLALPSDVVPLKVPKGRLKQPIDIHPTLSDLGVSASIAKRICQLIKDAERPLILVDGLCTSFAIAEEVNTFVKLTGIPTMCYPFGKGVIDESLNNFYGVYAGKHGQLETSAYASESDLVLLFGGLLSDNNTSGFSAVTSPDVTINFQLDRIQIPVGKLQQVPSRRLLRCIVELLQQDKRFLGRKYPPLKRGTSTNGSRSPHESTSAVTQDYLFASLGPYLRPHDHVCLASGTARAGGRDLVLPYPIRILSSAIFLSVGHWLPAAQGVSLALRELATDSPSTTGRTILLVGDGDFQSSGQEISTIIRERLDITIFLLNNSGYTTERLIHGSRASYNDIADWIYLGAPYFYAKKTGLGSAEYPVRTYRVQTMGDLDRVLNDGDFRNSGGLKMVEVILDPDDVPGQIASLLKRAGDALEA
jgi:pyruvate decarboxylase